jgi:DHHC palmitoyltransferase
VSWKKNPGHLKPIKDVPFVRLVQRCDPNQLCPSCEVIATPDSRHCYICNRCVERFDHHCQWLNNCIGVKNHSIFYLFILTLELYLISVVCSGLICTIIYHHGLCIDFEPTEVPDDTLYHSDDLTIDLPDVYQATTLLTICLAALFALPLSYLIVIQT